MPISGAVTFVPS